MDKEIIKEKIENIKKQDKNCLIFFKGFDSNFMEYISTLIPTFYQDKYYDSFGTDILSLIKDEKKLVKQLMGVENGIFSGKYEELILLEDVIGKYYDGKIVIINNNLYDIYPYKFKNLNDISEYSKGINDDEKLEDNSFLFNKIFSDIKFFKEEAFVSFLDISNDEIENIIKIDMYNSELNLIDIKEKENREGITFSYPMLSREELSYFKNSIYYNKIKEKVINFEIENYVQSNKKKLEDLSIIIKSANKKGYIINIFKKENIFEQKYREELLDILKKYWGDDKNFRTLKFYKDPDISNNLIDITQGELVYVKLKVYQYFS